MRYVLAVPRTVLTLLIGVVATVVMGPIAILIGHRRPTSPVIERMIRLWSRLWLIPAGCHLEVRGREHVDPSQSYIVVANHLSNFDIMACFLAVPVPIRYLAKKELFRVPILAPAMRAVGIVEVDREAHAAVHDQVNRQAKELIASGRSVIIYPEGTRSRSGELQRFKKGAFTMAVSTGLPILPVTLQGTWEAWRPDRPLIFGGTIRVVIDPPIPTGGLTHADTNALRDRVHDLIERRYTELRAEAARQS